MNAFQRARDLAHARLRDAVGRESPHNPQKTLVIIDMQSVFMEEDGSAFDIVPAICRLIRHAKSQEWAIVVVEYEDYGDTDVEIIDSIGEYPHWTTVCKNENDGGAEVIECIEAHPAWSMDLLVCGINGNACVPATVKSLFLESNLVEVAVVKDAVYPNYCSRTEELQERLVQTDDVICSRQESSVLS